MPRRRIHHRLSPVSHAFPVEPLVRLWLMRLLVPLGAHKEFIRPHGFSDEALAEMLGLQQWIDPVEFEFCPVSVRNELRKLHKTVETEFKSASVADCLARNLSRLSSLVGLTANDCRILEFAVLIHTERVLDDAADWLGNLSSLKMCGVLAVLLGLPERDIQTALSASGILARSGLVALGRGGPDRLRSRLSLLSAKFADHIISSDSDPVDLLRDAVSLSSPPVLDMADFEHLDELRLVRPYLKKALATGRRGVNIFMHGIPGTGKSQLAKALAREMGCELFEVSSEDEDGDPISGSQRLNALRAAQSFLAQRKSILLFDEVEDVFDDGMGLIGKKSTAQTHKAWLNRMLEENQVPVLWLSNSAQSLDPAFIRRFDLVFELPVPPKKQRERIIRAHCGGLLSEPVIARIAQAETLAPALVTRAAAVVHSIEGELGKHAAEAAFELIVNNTLETQGHARIPAHDADRLPATYHPAYINADTDIESIAAGLRGTKSGRLCLYGPPGTGKTAYGRWLAEQLEMPLLVKRGSDLMSMYVGGTEQNIAKAFSEAEREGAFTANLFYRLATEPCEFFVIFR